MADFDKLVKDKTEQNQYEFKNSSWKTFKKATGLRTIGLSSIVLGVVVSAVIISFTLLFFYLQTNSSTLHNVSSSILTEDTNSKVLLLNESTSETVNVPVVEQTTKVEKKVDNARTDKKSENIPQDSSKCDMDITTKNTVKKEISNIRPLIINVDTIKENIPSDEELKRGNSRIF